MGSPIPAEKGILFHKIPLQYKSYSYRRGGLANPSPKLDVVYCQHLAYQGILEVGGRTMRSAFRQLVRRKNEKCWAYSAPDLKACLVENALLRSFLTLPYEDCEVSHQHGWGVRSNF